ncbi:MAG: DMT family transporter [Pseudomonadota bacterium]
MRRRSGRFSSTTATARSSASSAAPVALPEDRGTAPGLSRRATLLAWGAVAVTVLVWASFLVAVRAAVATPLGPVEVGLLRFVTGAVLFAPVWLRRGPLPGGVRLHHAAMIAGCGGFLFILLLSTGMQFAPVADSGVFAPSMLPVYVALLSAIFLGDRFGPSRLFGLGLILLGAVAIGGWEAIANAGNGAWRGHILISLGAFGWAIYTVAFRISGMRALDAAAMITFWSALGFGVVALFVPLSFGAVPMETIALQVLFQGVLSGFVATFTYGYAIERLGATRVAAFAALVPVLAALGGWVFLGEPIGLVKSIGIAVVATGVALASGAVAFRRAAPGPAPSTH